MATRGRGARAMFHCTCAGLGLFGAVADGGLRVRRAAREQLRNSANHLKVMAGGGVMSPTDPIQGAVFARVRAICEEAAAADTYVMAHAYSARSIERAVGAPACARSGGNLLDERSARAMKRRAPIWCRPGDLRRAGRRSGEIEFIGRVQCKNWRSRATGSRRSRITRNAGVPIAFGTGHLPRANACAPVTTEFALRLPAMSPAEITERHPRRRRADQAVRQAGRDRARCRRRPAGGEWRSDRDLAPLLTPERGLLAVMKAGQFYRNRLLVDSRVAATQGASFAR